ncbi:MAG TPA: Type 1 glutamine amidotransferase-like domain-containing protein [Candidatus Limnocylindrales bacterium]
MSGPIGLHGGGECLSGDEPFLASLLAAARPAVTERLGTCLPGTSSDPGRLRVAIVPTAAARQDAGRAAATCGTAIERTAARAGVEAWISTVPIVDIASAASPTLAAVLAGADVVYLPGGDPDLIPTLFAGSAAWRAILAAHARGAVVAGASAGAMALGGWTWTPAGGQPGLGLVPGLVVAPHLDPRRPESVASRVAVAVPPDAALRGIVGLAERTGLIGERQPGGERRWRVHGEGLARWEGRDGTVLEGRDGDVLALPI